MQTFEAKQLTNGQSVTYDVGSGFEYVRIINESGYQLTASLGSLGTETIPVWHLMDINCINRNTGRPLLTGSIGIMPLQLSNVNPALFPSTFVQVVGYLPGELPSPLNMALSRLNNIGNSAPVSTSAVSIANDGNPASTSIVESTVAGDASSAVKITNDAQVTFGNVPHPATLLVNGNEHITGTSTIDTTLHVLGNAGVQAATNSNVALLVSTNFSAQQGVTIFPGGSGWTGDLLHIEDNSFSPLFVVDHAGNLNVDAGGIQMNGTGQITTGAGVNLGLGYTNTDRSVMEAQIGAVTFFKGATGIQFQVPNGTTVGSADSTGFHLGSASTHYNFLSGSLSRVSAFNGTGSGTYNHNLGATPLWVGPIVSQVGSATQGFDSANGTQVHVTLGAALNFQAFCIAA